MNVLIAGGSGFLGRALSESLLARNHNVTVLTRRAPRQPNHIQWDGYTTNGWSHLVNEMDAVVNLTGYGLDHGPWTKRQKQRFADSRVLPGLALVSAFEKASRRPNIFLQTSGINRYGLRGDGIADESFPPANDFLGQLTVQWENATQPIEELGVRRVVIRSAVVLARRGGLFPLMTLPVRLFFGGRFGEGSQAMNWIHVSDYVNAMCFLLENEHARGPYNLISPEPTTNADFMREIARALHRPYWFHIPSFLLRMAMGEMSVLLTEGRFAQPKRLLESGFKFQFGTLEDALTNLLA